MIAVYKISERQSKYIQLTVKASTMKSRYEIAEKRHIVVKKNEICFLEDASNKKATLSYSEWASFLEQFVEIDNAVGKIIKQDEDVKLRNHLGAGWHVSVTSGVYCIDLRRFFIAVDGSVRPTREGFAIRLREWSRVKQLTEVIKTHHPKIADAQPCWTQVDHYNQEGAIQCPECSFYMSTMSADNAI